MSGQDVRVWHKDRLLAIVHVRSRSIYGASIEIKQALGAARVDPDYDALATEGELKFDVWF